MRRVVPSLLVSLSLVSVVACGASRPPPVTIAAAPPPVQAEASEPADVSAPEPASPPPSVPKTCADGPDAPKGEPALCVPDPAFVKRLCTGSFAEVGLALLAKDTPFTRAYMRGDAEGWNAEGGTVRARLKFDEELLVLKRHTPNPNAVVKTVGADYLVMRWDGNCYTLQDGEITLTRPPSPKYAPVPWRSLTQKTRDLLLERPSVLAAYQKRGKECQGAFSGEVTRACEDADRALSNAVAAEVRQGAVIVEPERLP